ncbi:putative membrane protein, partial [Glycine soja]
AGALIGPIAFAIIVIGNSAIILGLWSAHAVWTYYCVARKNRFGLVFKLVVLMGLPVPLLLWPIVGIVGSLLGGIGYGFFAPLLATFQAVGEGENVNQKFYHCFIDGCWSTIERSCTVVQDVTDFCFHSYFSYMDELRENLPPHEKLLDIRLSLLPCCLLVIMVGVSFDMALIISIAIWKSPYMLFKGWKRLLEDLIGIKGPFLETECVPFAGLAIILWPLAVVEDSVKMGFIYIVSVVSLFDEYVSDLLYLREGSCFPRPIYRRNMSHAVEGKNLGGGDNDLKNRRDGSQNSKHSIQQSRTYDVVLTRTNGPKDRVFEWFIGPLLIMKEQLKNLELEGTEETCLKELVMKCKNEVLEESDSTGFPSDNTVRRAQLQAIIRSSVFDNLMTETVAADPITNAPIREYRPFFCIPFMNIMEPFRTFRTPFSPLNT